VVLSYYDRGMLDVHGFVASRFLSDDQQSYVRNEIEDQKDDFDQPEERV